MNSNLFGTVRVSERLYVSIFFPIALFLFLCGQGFVYSLLFIASAFVHEMSHLFFLYRYGAQINRVSLYPFGVDICADTRRLSYKKEIVCTLAGSISNLVLAAVSVLFMHLCPSPLLLFFTMCNLSLGILNLIPLSFFDGGKALRLILYDSLDIDKAFYVHKFLDIVSALIFSCFALFIAAGSDFNLSVCAIIIYAAISTFALYRKTPI